MLLKNKDKIIYYNDSGLDESEISVIVSVVNNNSFKEYVKELGLNYNEVKDKGILIDELRYWSTETEKLIILAGPRSCPTYFKPGLRDIAPLANTSIFSKQDNPFIPSRT